jgi:hypothetical protein
MDGDVSYCAPGGRAGAAELHPVGGLLWDSCSDRATRRPVESDRALLCAESRFLRSTWPKFRIQTIGGIRGQVAAGST